MLYTPKKRLNCVLYLHFIVVYVWGFDYITCSCWPGLADANCNGMQTAVWVTRMYNKCYVLFERTMKMRNNIFHIHSSLFYEYECFVV